MLFNFLKYISSTWYFNLIPEGQSTPYFVDYRKLSSEEQALLDIDGGYKTLQGKLADAAYQAWQKGIMKTEPGYSLYNAVPFQKKGRKKNIKLYEGCTVTVRKDVFVTDVLDNYRFIKRFFNPALVWYILLVRLISLHNPFIELKGFICAIKVKRIDLYSKNSWLLLEEKYKSFESELIKLKPKVSVIIPTLNRYTYLRDVLKDLQKQDYVNFEVIIVDQSDNYDADFYKGWELAMKVIRQEEKALWLARNTAVKYSNSEYIAFSEDDVRINPYWISQHLKCIDFFRSDISAGVFFPASSEIPVSKGFFKWADQFATGNALLKKSVFLKTGLFDRQFEKQRSGDGEYGLRCYLTGFVSVSNPFAYCRDVKAPTGGLREQGSWDSFRPTRFFAPRPVPSVLYLSRKYFGNHISMLMLLFSVPGSVIPYKYKSKKWLKLVAGISLILIWPVLLFQVLFAWSKATDKLNAGPLIEKPMN